MEDLYFYGHKNTNKGYLSNFFESPFTDENGVYYFCMEQYIMKKKQETFDPDNADIADKIMRERDPARIKQYGRRVANFNNDVWAQARVQVAYDGILLKFTQNPRLRRDLLSTNDQVLYEASANDAIWGIGFNATDALRVDKSQYGENLLGKTLMRVRDELRK